MIPDLVKSLIGSLTLDTVILLVGALVFLLTLGRWNKDPKERFVLSDLLIGQDGRASLDKVGQFVALSVSTWGFVYVTRGGTLSEYYFTGYMLSWGGLGVAKAYLAHKAVLKDPASSSTEDKNLKLPESLAASDTDDKATKSR